MNVLVLQLCRMGDIVQSFPLLERLRQEGHDVDILIRDSFQDVPIPQRLAHRVHHLPVFIDEPRSVGEYRKRSEQLETLLLPLRSRAFDLALNLSYDELSVLIAKYVDATTTRGLTIGDDRTTRALDPWGQLLLGIPRNRHWGAFNLADLYIHMAGLSPSGSPTSVRAATSVKTRVARPQVAIVPGASDPRKRWPAAHFGQLATALTREQVSVSVIGTPTERELAELVCREASSNGTREPIANLAGTTDVTSLATLLADSDLVVTNDTGTMHLAASVGTRTLTLTLGPAHVFESGPYGKGHISLEPVLHCHPCEFGSQCFDTVCHPTLNPSLVSSLAVAMVSGNSFDRETITAARSCRVYESFVDSAGRLKVRPITAYPITTRDILRPIYGALWESSLGASIQSRTPQDIAAELADHWEISKADESSTDGPVHEVLTLAASAQSLAEKLEVGAASLLAVFRSDEKNRPSQLGVLLESLQKECDLMGELDHALRPMTAFVGLQLSMAGARGSSSVFSDLLSAVSGGANRARLFQQLVTEVVHEVASILQRLQNEETTL